MTEIDKAIANLRVAREVHARALQQAREEIVAGERELAVIDAKIWGLEHARDLFIPSEPEKTRHDVQGPVMGVLSDGGTWGEDAIIETVNRLPRDADIPAASIHKFLVRAVREGKVLLTDEGYQIPPVARAAE